VIALSYIMAVIQSGPEVYTVKINRTQCVNLPVCVFHVVAELIIAHMVNGVLVLSYSVLNIPDKQMVSACKTGNKYSMTFILASFVYQSCCQNADVLMKAEVRLNCFLLFRKLCEGVSWKDQ